MKVINGQLFKQMVICGANVLHNNFPEIDALNVFPVPDGDTGTNMSLTFTAGANDIASMTTNSISEIAKKLSKGLLMGARGNSGVILSQIFRGIAQGLEDKEEVNAVEFAQALTKGAEVAYRAVMRPTEGTILTVIRESATETSAYAKDDMEMQDLFSYFVERAQVSLDHTPELLPVLKEVGVVDSGGAGLVLILSGFLAGLNGDMIERVEVVADTSKESLVDVQTDDEEGYGYCTEFIFRLDPRKRKSFTEDRLKTELANIPGNSIVVVQDEDIVKVHVHTLKPGNALNLAQRFGEFIKLKIENMQEQHNNIIASEPTPAKKAVEEKVEREHKDTALISVAAGDGVKDMFFELRCDEVVSGGQTMNPSAEDIVAAVREVNADNVIILPNNSNIVMTAQQAAIILEDEINVIVIPSKTIPQGLSACIMYNPEADIESNIDEMTEAIANVKTGQVTFAIKDTNIDGVDIKANDYMALVEKKIVACIPDKVEACKRALRELVTEDDEIVTLIGGEDVTSDELDELVDFCERNFEVEVEVHNGLQPVYSFIIGVE